MTVAAMVGSKKHKVDGEGKYTEKPKIQIVIIPVQNRKMVKTIANVELHDAGNPLMVLFPLSNGTSKEISKIWHLAADKRKN